MTSLIHGYLNEHFIFVDGKIRTKSDYNRTYGLFSYIYIDNSISKVIEELILIFALTKKELKYYIKGWVRKQNRGFDFEKYWNPLKIVFGNYLLSVRRVYNLPSIRRVYSRTIGIDLARVEQPEPIRNNAMIERYSRQVVNSRFYGTINISGTGTTQSEISPEAEQQRLRRQRIIQLWENQREYLNR
jgi:hypothetical protein